MAPRKTPSKGGKPDKLMRDAIMLSLHREALGSDGKTTKKMYLLADRLVDKAIEGDVQAIKEVNDRADGKAHQSVALTDPDGGALTVHIVQFSGKAADAV